MVKTMPSLYNSEQSMRSATQAHNGTVTCTVCSAFYAPSSAHKYLVSAPRIGLESAFMSMCHFCFRCRRPACPLCWDDIHGLCAACVEDVHLPFRKEAEPLPLNSTLLVPSPTHSTHSLASSFPLVCLRPGRFQDALSQDEGRESATPIKTTVPVVELQQQETHDDAPVQDVLMDVQRNKDLGDIARRVEHILTVLLGVILFVIAALIVAASFSAQANTAIVHVLHVDIRMEIEYLLQLIQQIH